MNKKVESKQNIVDEVRGYALEAQSVVAADYSGVPVSDIDQLRKLARDKQVKVKVVKNTLARRAFVDTPCASVTDHIRGPVMLAFSFEEPSAAAKVIKDFIRDVEQFEVKAIGVGDTLYAGSDLDRVAKLPTKMEALGMLVYCLKAPITKLVTCLSDPTNRLVIVLKAVADQKS